jgi:hypothetical protein
MTMSAHEVFSDFSGFHSPFSDLLNITKLCSCIFEVSKKARGLWWYAMKEELPSRLLLWLCVTFPNMVASLITTKFSKGDKSQILKISTRMSTKGR